MCNALVLVLLYCAFRRCMTLIGDRPCDQGSSAAECSSAVEWTLTAAGVAQAMVSVVVATVHRQSSTAGLLNRTYDVLARGRGGGDEATGSRRRSHLGVGGAYAAAVAAIVVARSAAIVAARPGRFTVADVLLLSAMPAAVVAVTVECSIVCMCSVAENACHDVVDRLSRLRPDRGGVARAAKRCSLLHWRLEFVWRDYWRTCRLVDCLSECYGLELAVDLTANMLYFIVYAYVTIKTVYYYAAHTGGSGNNVDEDATSALYWNVALACQLACVSFRIVFISYRADKIKQVVRGVHYISRVPTTGISRGLKNKNFLFFFFTSYV